MRGRHRRDARRVETHFPMPRHFQTEPPPALAARLEPGERLLWWGRPCPTIALQRRDLLLVPLAVAWLGLVLYWQGAAALQDWTLNRSLDALMVGLPLFLIGLYMLAGRFLAEAWLRRRTVYAVTARRAHVLSPMGRHALRLDELGTCRIEGEPAGRRTLAFARNPLKQFQFNWSRGFMSRRPAGFSLIGAAEADAALAAIRAAQGSAG
jgi:hypothetical protein